MSETLSKFKDTIIGKIPVDWEVKRLGDVSIGKGVYGINASAVEYKDNLPRYLRITDIDEEGYFSTNKLSSVIDENSKDFYLKKGDLIFVRTGSTTGKSYLYNEKDGLLVYAGFLIKFSIDDTKANDYYIWNYTKTTMYYDWVQKFSQRSGQPGLNSNEYSNLLIPIPPLREQQKIAGVLYTWDKAIQETDTIIKNLQKRNKALAFSLLTGKRRVRNNLKESFHKTNLGTKYPIDWKIISVKNIFNDRKEKSSDQAKYPLYSLTIDKGLTEKTDRYERSFLLKNQDSNEYKVIYPNDILFNPMNLRFGAIAKSNINKIVSVSAYYSSIYKIVEDVNLDFYISLFKTELFINLYDRIAIGSLLEKKRVHLSNFLELEIPYPSFEEQNAIAEILNTANKELKQYQEKLNNLKIQKKGLMQQLLTGKVRTV